MLAPSIAFRYVYGVGEGRRHPRQACYNSNWDTTANAELEAAKRADLMLDRGDDGRRLVWQRIRRAIEALQAPLSGRLN
jgi:hypothetical protein